MCRDALDRDESAGCHFREEHVTADGEAKRNDQDYTHVAAWEYKGENEVSIKHKEELEFDYVPLTTRSYK
jgi:succinate dehydrogenase / fumarate reductase flavoprotein subunit